MKRWGEAVYTLGQEMHGDQWYRSCLSCEIEIRWRDERHVREKEPRQIRCGDGIDFCCCLVLYILGMENVGLGSGIDKTPQQKKTEMAMSERMRNQRLIRLLQPKHWQRQSINFFHKTRPLIRLTGLLVGICRVQRHKSQDEPTFRLLL